MLAVAEFLLRKLLCAADWCMGVFFLALWHFIKSAFDKGWDMRLICAMLVTHPLLNASSCTSTMEYTCSIILISSWHKLPVSQVYKISWIQKVFFEAHWKLQRAWFTKILELNYQKNNFNSKSSKPVFFFHSQTHRVPFKIYFSTFLAVRQFFILSTPIVWLCQPLVQPLATREQHWDLYNSWQVLENCCSAQ